MRALLLILLCLAVPAEATERLQRDLTRADGLPVDHVQSLGQDDAGFLWIGTAVGLARFDGERVQAIAPETLKLQVNQIAAGSGVALVEYGGRAWEIQGERALPLKPPGATGVARSVAWHGARLLALFGETLWQRDGGWSELAAPPGLYRVVSDEAGPLGLSPEGVWRLGGDPQLLLPVEGAVHAVGGDGVHAITGWGRSWSSSASGPHRWSPDAEGRGMSVAWRDGVLWASQDRRLRSYQEGRLPRSLEGGEGISSGGPLLVDREGSLWLGSFHGLHQFPEPETQAWTERDGLPGRHARFLVGQGDDVLVSTWAGHARFAGATEGLSTFEGAQLLGRLCRDGAGVVWSVGAEPVEGGPWIGAVLGLGPEGTRRYPIEGATAHAEGCASSSAGSVWLILPGGLFETRAEGAPVRRADLPPAVRSSALGRHGLEDSRGRLWIAGGPGICHADADAVRRDAAEWSCETLEGNEGLLAVVESAGGRVWTAGVPGGLYAWDGGWQRLAASDDLPHLHLSNLVRTGDELWLVGHGLAARIEEDPERGFRVVDELGGADGLLPGAIMDVLNDGESLWVAGAAGLQRVSRSRGEAPPPPVRLVDVHVGGVRQAVDSLVQLPSSRSDLELRFAGLSYRSPERLIYRWRLDGAAWSGPMQRPWFQLVEHRPGPHRLEVQASLDGRRWSEPAHLDYAAPRPWYLRPAFLLGLAAGIGLLALVAFRARLAFLVGLERVRTRVAMDLHDEVGSGLGSIRLLSDLVGSGVIEGPEAADLARQVGSTASELSGSLADIVWSLRPGSADVEKLLRWLHERAQALFPDADGCEVVLRGSPARAPLALEVLREVQLIGVEALHNARRHGGAKRLVLGLERAGARWRLSIEDDGGGLDQPSVGGSGSGTGLEGMRRRAAGIGAELDIGPSELGGVAVVVTFPPRPPRSLQRSR